MESAPKTPNEKMHEYISQFVKDMRPFMESHPDGKISTLFVNIDDFGYSVNMDLRPNKP